MVESQSAIIKPNRKAGRALDQRHSAPAFSLPLRATMTPKTPDSKPCTTQPDEQPVETASNTPAMTERQDNEPAVQPVRGSQPPAPAPVQQDAAPEASEPPAQRTTDGETPETPQQNENDDQPGDVESRAKRRSTRPGNGKKMYWFGGNGPAAQPTETSEMPGRQPIDIARCIRESRPTSDPTSPPSTIARCIRESRQAPVQNASRRPTEKVLRFDPTTNPWDWICDLANALRKLASDLVLKWSASDVDLAHVYYGSVVQGARLLLAEVSSQRDQVFGSPQLEAVRPRVVKAVEILQGLDTEWQERDDYWQTHLAGPYDAKTLMEVLSDELAKFEGYLERHKVIKELEDTAAGLNTCWTSSTTVRPVERRQEGDGEMTPGTGTESFTGEKAPGTGKPYILSPDRRSGTWYKIPCAFTSTQAEIVSILLDAYESGAPDVDAELLIGKDAFTQEKLKAKGKKPSAAKRVRDVFRNNPALGTIIVPGHTRGTYRLKRP